MATFYSQFSLRPKGENVVSVCTGTACYVKGAQAVLEEVENVLGIKAGETTKDGKFTIQDTRCLGCCGLAPVMVINEDVYGRLTPADIKGILRSIDFSAAIQAFSAAGGTGRQGDGSRFPAESGRETKRAAHAARAYLHAGQPLTTTFTQAERQDWI